MTDCFGLAGHRALVTGGTQGVGAAIAVSIANAGADVLLVGLRDDDRARATLASCRRHGVRAELITTDLARPPQEYLDELLGRVESYFPDIDLLVNNAGTFIDLPFLEMTYDRYVTTMHLNVTSGYFLTQAFARRWIDAGVSGRVLFTGSINGLLAEPDHSAYDTSKGAVAAMVRSLCVALAPHGIRVNSMAPGLVRTPLTSEVLDRDAALNDWMKLHTPNGRVPNAEVCGPAAVFLLSDAAEHIHGQTLLVDGGMSAWQQPDVPTG
jgi:NAD(P)-dependent dehydrogenase (short-subunit alcohol dehydrogenase family)